MTDQPSTQERCPTCRCTQSPCYFRCRDPRHGSQDVEGATGSHRRGRDLPLSGLALSTTQERCPSCRSIDPKVFRGTVEPGKIYHATAIDTAIGIADATSQALHTPTHPKEGEE